MTEEEQNNNTSTQDFDLNKTWKDVYTVRGLLTECKDLGEVIDTLVSEIVHLTKLKDNGVVLEDISGDTLFLSTSKKDVAEKFGFVEPLDEY